MRVSVFGLGYVGAVSAACLVKNGHSVVGVDPDERKLDPIRNGKSPIVEKDLEDYLGAAVGAGRLRVTQSAADGIAETDLSLICVGTPSRDNGDLKTDFVERVCLEIGEALRGRTDYHCVVIRSTVLPGTTENLAIPALEKASGKKAGQDFGIAMNPEFLREGTAIADFDRPPFTVIGAINDRDHAKVEELYAGVDAPLVRTSLREAEAIKYVCNCFHALKITFANEIGMLCKMEGIDARKVMEIACMDTKLNVSKAYLKPGFAFGGSCLPKDLRATTYRARSKDTPLPTLDALLASNRAQIERIVDRIKRTGKREVGMLGISFKPGTDDLRDSPLVALAEQLIGKGYKLRVFDPNVSYAALYGSNKAFIEKEIPHIAEILFADPAEVLDASEVLIFSHNAPEFTHLIPKVRSEQHVLDLAGVGTPSEFAGSYDGIYW